MSCGCSGPYNQKLTFDSRPISVSKANELARTVSFVAVKNVYESSPSGKAHVTVVGALQEQNVSSR